MAAAVVALAPLLAAAAPGQTVWTAATMPVVGDVGVCAAKAERAFAAMGFATWRRDVPGDARESLVGGTDPSRPMRLTAYCRPGQLLVLLGGFAGQTAELEAARDRFKAELALARPASPPPARPAAAASPIAYPEAVTAEIKFYGNTSNCFAEARPMLVGAGYQVHGQLDSRLVVGSTPDRRFFALVDCATNRTSKDFSMVKLRMAVAPGVTREARDAEAKRLGGLVRTSPAETARAEAALQRRNAELARIDAEQERLQQAQIREAQRVAQAQADAAQYGARAASGMRLDESEIARRAATAIQAGRAYGGSDGAIIMEQLPPGPEYVPGPAYQEPPRPDWAQPGYAPPPSSGGRSCEVPGCVSPQ